MGHEIERVLIDRGHTVLFTVDAGEEAKLATERLAQADVAIEFTTPATAFGNVETCLRVGVPVVCGTTGWNERREEAEKQILRRCLMATAKLLETAAAGATERLESGEGSLKEVKELGGILQALVGTAAKMCQSEKNKDTAVNEIRVIMSEEVEALSG